MNIEGAFPSTFLKASDLGGKKVSVIMDRVEINKVGDDNKPLFPRQGKRSRTQRHQQECNCRFVWTGD